MSRRVTLPPTNLGVGSAQMENSTYLIWELELTLMTLRWNCLFRKRRASERGRDLDLYVLCNGK